MVIARITFVSWVQIKNNTQRNTKPSIVSHHFLASDSNNAGTNIRSLFRIVLYKLQYMALMVCLAFR